MGAIWSYFGGIQAWPRTTNMQRCSTQNDAPTAYYQRMPGSIRNIIWVGTLSYRSYNTLIDDSYCMYCQCLMMAHMKTAPAPTERHGWEGNSLHVCTIKIYQVLVRYVAPRCSKNSKRNIMQLIWLTIPWDPYVCHIWIHILPSIYPSFVSIIYHTYMDPSWVSWGTILPRSSGILHKSVDRNFPMKWSAVDHLLLPPTCWACRRHGTYKTQTVWEILGEYFNKSYLSGILGESLRNP